MVIDVSLVFVSCYLFLVSFYYTLRYLAIAIIEEMQVSSRINISSNPIMLPRCVIRYPLKSKPMPPRKAFKVGVRELTRGIISAQKRVQEIIV